MSEKPAAPDASMELLSSIVRESIDSEYQESGPDASRAGSIAGLVAGLLAGLLIGVYAFSLTRPAVVDEEREELIAQIEAVSRANEELSDQADEVRAEVADLQSQLAPSDDADTEPLAVAAGTAAVTGPGVVITISDNSDDPDGLIVDQDLRIVTNALWRSGAEAIDINGHRMTPLTAIRQAGGAVTVNYNSLTSPYEVRAIGDSSRLAGEFSTGTGAAWLIFLQQNYGVEWSIEQHTSTDIEGETVTALRYARVSER